MNRCAGVAVRAESEIHGGDGNQVIVQRKRSDGRGCGDCGVRQQGVASMAESTDINLPRSYTAGFPDRCVVCCHDKPTSHVRLITGTLGWWTWLLWWWGKPFVVKAPACSGCAWKLHAWRFISLAVTIVITVAAIWLIWPYFRDAVPDGLRRWFMMGLALVCLLPQIIFEVLFARPFDLTAYADSVDYEFTSKDYAVEFATLNFDAEWVKVNGENIKP